LDLHKKTLHFISPQTHRNGCSLVLYQSSQIMLIHIYMVAFFRQICMAMAFTARLINLATAKI